MQAIVVSVQRMSVADTDTFTSAGTTLSVALPMKFAAPFLRRTMEHATAEEAECLRRLAENAAL